MKTIHEAVRKRYSEVSRSAEGLFSYPTGKAGALALGYDAHLFENIDDALLNSFCGVGNPFSLGDIVKGSLVLDIGCGAGFDLYIASQLAGRDGKAVGIDPTTEMVDRARANLRALQCTNVDIVLISAEKLPFEDNVFDTVISNGVINLSPDKSSLFREIFRVLRSGGLLQIADIVLEKELPPQLASSVESWAQ